VYSDLALGWTLVFLIAMKLMLIDTGLNKNFQALLNFDMTLGCRLGVVSIGIQFALVVFLQAVVEYSNSEMSEVPVGTLYAVHLAFTFFNLVILGFDSGRGSGGVLGVPLNALIEGTYQPPSVTKVAEQTQGMQMFDEYAFTPRVRYPSYPLPVVFILSTEYLLLFSSNCHCPHRRERNAYQHHHLTSTTAQPRRGNGSRCS
jgi:hypothetical protein